VRHGRSLTASAQAVGREHIAAAEGQKVQAGEMIPILDATGTYRDVGRPALCSSPSCTIPRGCLWKACVACVTFILTLHYFCRLASSWMDSDWVVAGEGVSERERYERNHALPDLDMASIASHPIEERHMHPTGHVLPSASLPVCLPTPVYAYPPTAR